MIDMNETTGIRERLKQLLSERRYAHSLAVEASARELAAAYGGDIQRTALAGVLHDCCKDMDDAFLLKYIQSRGILLDNLWLKLPMTWHSLAAASYIEEEFRIDDPEIINAVRCHTTGKPAMSMTEKILFVADKISADRNYPGVAELRTLAGENLDAAVLAVLGRTISSLAKKRLPIINETYLAYHYYIQEEHHDLS